MRSVVPTALSTAATTIRMSRPWTARRRQDSIHALKVRQAASASRRTKVEASEAVEELLLLGRELGLGQHPAGRERESFSIASNGSTWQRRSLGPAPARPERRAGLPDRVGERLEVALHDPRDRDGLLADRRSTSPVDIPDDVVTSRSSRGTGRARESSPGGGRRFSRASVSTRTPLLRTCDAERHEPDGLVVPRYAGTGISSPG